METRGLGAGSYPMAPEKDETNITIQLEVKTSDVFPETWEKEEIESEIKANIWEYLHRGEIEIIEVEI